MLPTLATVTIGLLLALSAFEDPAAEFPTDLSRWRVTERPDRDGDLWTVANHDRHEWVVSLGADGPQVGLRPPGRAHPAPLPFEVVGGRAADGLAGERKAVRVDDGWVVSYNAGEFGAGLWWFSPDGKRRDRLSAANVVDLVPTRAGVLAFEGLAHGHLTAGTLSRLARGGDGRWRSETVLDLGALPWAVAEAADGSLVVATSERLLRLQPETLKVDVILPHLPWKLAYPNSMVIDPSGTIYVGMRRYVARIKRQKTAYRLRWLVPDQAFEDR